MLIKPIYFAGQPGGNFGWGVCNKYLLQEMSRLTRVLPMGEGSPEWRDPALPGYVFTPLLDHNLDPATPARGLGNFGYTFFENELTARSVANAAKLDAVFVGCSWCRERLREKGIHNGVLLIQGVDTQVFKLNASPNSDRRFVVFSGGKFELRKGQDLVLRAFEILHRRYADIFLVNAWFNQWTGSLMTMESSPHIRFELRPASWLEQMNHLYQLNGIDPARVLTVPLISQDQMVALYHRTDLGLFPNRCEGGTNLVMMEYMACGKPVVATYGSGHCDVLNERNAVLLKTLTPFQRSNGHGKLAVRWVEPSIDEIVEKVEYAYHHRNDLRTIGLQAALDMRQLTWEKTAQTVLHTIAGRFPY